MCSLYELIFHGFTKKRGMQRRKPKIRKGEKLFADSFKVTKQVNGHSSELNQPGFVLVLFGKEKKCHKTSQGIMKMTTKLMYFFTVIFPFIDCKFVRNMPLLLCVIVAVFFVGARNV